MRRRPGLTLIEMIVVGAILALLATIVLSGTAQARRMARTGACQAALRGLGTALAAYATTHADAVVPSYNMSGTTVGAHNPLDGWAVILDRENFAGGAAGPTGNAFYCPDTLPRAGLAAAQTGADPENPRGFMDWPAVLTLSQAYARPLPERGMPRVLRVAYWINGENPIGRPLPIRQGAYYTGSVGYGSDPFGRTLRANRLGDITRPSATIALADGLYAGNQEGPRPGDRDLRIGYRHLRGAAATNVAFADGHVSMLRGDAFPRDLGGAVPNGQVREENLGGRPTCYADPEKWLSATP
ncbi:MAG: type II secretion system protein [Phycisphaerales bacterium]|nr:type II secretion system protein [Phycisphaerales bacterium]